MKVLFEDNHLLVCVKEPGILSQAGSLDLDDMLTLGKKYIKEKYQKPGNVFLGLVHRLDVNVGGVMVFARTSKAAARLSKSIRENEFSKHYLAIVEGEITYPSSGTMINYLRKNPESLISEETDEGQEAVLHYRVLETIKRLTLIQIELVTGRFHQIRKQFSLRNTPLYGDVKYHSSSSSQTLPLWAYLLEFPHPITNELMRFKAIPDSFVFDKFTPILKQLIDVS